MPITPEQRKRITDHLVTQAIVPGSAMSHRLIQANAILDQADECLPRAGAVVLARDEHGVALLRDQATGETWRGSSVRDVLARWLQAKAG